MNITIKNPNKLPVIDYRLVKPLQGNLKDLTKDNYDKLKNVLVKRGFEILLFLYLQDGTYYMLDGHGRQRLMLAEDMNDKGSYEVPYILVEAKDKIEAKAKLLEITSQYQTMTQEGYDEFIADIPEVELYDVNFDALPNWARGLTDSKEIDTDSLLDTTKTLHCPRCGFEFEPKNVKQDEV